MKTILLIVGLAAVLASTAGCDCWNYCSKGQGDECGGVGGDEGTCRANCQGDDSKEMDCKLDCDPDWSCERWLKCICGCDDDMVWNTEYGFCAEKQGS